MPKDAPVQWETCLRLLLNSKKQQDGAALPAPEFLVTHPGALSCQSRQSKLMGLLTERLTERNS